MKYYLGIDLGTSSMKSVLVNDDGKIINNHSQNYRLITNNKGWVEQDPVEWINALFMSFGYLKNSNPQEFNAIRSISVTGQMHGIIPVDESGMPLYNAIIWSDQRNSDELTSLESLYSQEKWSKTTGNIPNISFSLGKILWIKKHMPDLYQKTCKFLLPKDFIRFQLTGMMSTERTDASATLMVDSRNSNWSEDILKDVEIDVIKLPVIKESAEIEGVVTKRASSMTGLKEGIAVVMGCGDSQGQAIGNGLMDEKGWLCTIGTSGQIMVSIDRYTYEEQGRVHTFSHPEEEKWVLQGSTLSAGSSMKWLAENVLGSKDSITSLLDRANKVGPGSNGLIYLPYLFGERTPYMDEKAKGSFIGLTYHHKKEDIVRSVVEGVIFSLYQAYELIAKLQGQKPEYLIVTGGVFNHELWRTAVADIFGLPVHVKSDYAGASYGAAMLAAVGVGDYADLKEVQTAWGITNAQHIIQPISKNHQVYMEYFKIYEESYQSINSIFHRLHDLSRKEDTSYES